MSDDDARRRTVQRIVRETRRRQGLPRHVEDRATLDRIAALVLPKGRRT